MKQPEQWSKYAEAILSTGERPHFAPEQETLDVHERQLGLARNKKGEPLNVLILGATPELADLALKYECRVQRVDCNPAMFAAARKRQTIANRHNETLIVSDWLDLPMIRNGSIDFVLGDSSLNNIPHALMSVLINEMARITHSNSTFSLRQIVLPDSAVENYEFHNAVTSYRTGKISANEFHKVLRFYSFIDDAYDTELRILDAKKVFRAIAHKHRTHGLKDAEYEFLYSRYSEIQHTIYRQSEQEEWLDQLGSCRIERAGEACFYANLFNVFVIQRH